MLWTSSQQTVIDQFIQEIKTIGWFKQVGEPSEKYWVIDTIWEACDTYGHQMLEVWGQNSELIEQKALRQLKDEQIDAIFEAVSLAIGNEVYEALCDLEDKIGQETGEDQSGIEEEILDFIKRDTAWACIERLLGRKRVFLAYSRNQPNRTLGLLVGRKIPEGKFHYSIIFRRCQLMV